MNPSGSILAFAFDPILTNASYERFQGILVTSVRILAPSNALRKKPSTHSYNATGLSGLGNQLPGKLGS